MLYWSLLGCTAAGTDDAVVDMAFSVQPSAEVATVVDVSWAGLEGQLTRVEMHDEEGPLLATDWREEGEQTATVVGVPASTRLWARVVDEESLTLATRPFQTGPLPFDLPALELSGEPGWDGLLATSYMGAIAAAIIIDERGVVRWYRMEQQGFLFRVRLLPDGSGIRYLFEFNPRDNFSSFIAEAKWSGGDVVEISGEQHPTHDFAQLDDGVIGMITSYQLDPEDPTFTGNEIVERSVDGDFRSIWDARQGYFPGGIPDGADPKEYWTHGNALQYEANRDVWWVGFRNLDALVAVERASGGVLERLGGVYSDHEFGAGADFSAQHAWQVVDGGILLHDNGGESTDNSRVVELAVADSTQEVSLVREFVHDPPLWVYAMGEPARLSDGTVLVSWGSAGVIDDFSPDGRLRASLQSEFGAGLGYFEYHEGFPGQVELR